MSMGDREYVDVSLTPFYTGHAWAPVQYGLANAWSQAYFHAQRKGRLCLQQHWPYNKRLQKAVGDIDAITGADYRGLTYGYRRLRYGCNGLRALILFACPLLNEFTVTHRLSAYSFNVGNPSDSALQVNTYQAGKSGLLSQYGTEDYYKEITPQKFVEEPFSGGFAVNFVQLRLQFSDIPTDENKRCLIYLDVKTETADTDATRYQPQRVMIFSEMNL